MILFSQFPQRNISSSFFQYSDKTINITETNDTSTERSDVQFFEVGKSEGVALSGGLHAYLLQKDIEKKNGAKTECKKKKKKIITPILFLFYELSVCQMILYYNKVYLTSSLIAKPRR